MMRLTKGVALAVFLSAPMSARAAGAPGQSATPRLSDAAPDRRIDPTLTGADGMNVPGRVIAELLADTLVVPAAPVLTQVLAGRRILIVHPMDDSPQADDETSGLWTTGASVSDSSLASGIKVRSSTYEFHTREQTGIGTIRAYVRIDRFRDAVSLEK